MSAGDHLNWDEFSFKEGDGFVRAFREGDAEKKKVSGALVWNRPSNEIRQVIVQPDLRRQGLATELYRRAKERNPEIKHSERLTDDGRAWRDSLSD